jgi:hypothetical protein
LTAAFCCSWDGLAEVGLATVADFWLACEVWDEVLAVLEWV